MGKVPQELVTVIQPPSGESTVSSWGFVALTNPDLRGGEGLQLKFIFRGRSKKTARHIRTIIPGWL